MHDFLPPLKTLGLPRVGKNGVKPSQVLKRLRIGKGPRYSDSPAELEAVRQALAAGGVK
jgi:hypothetical protein